MTKPVTGNQEPHRLKQLKETTSWRVVGVAGDGYVHFRFFPETTKRNYKTLGVEIEHLLSTGETTKRNYKIWNRWKGVRTGGIYVFSETTKRNYKVLTQ